MSGEHELLTERLRLRRWKPQDEAAMVAVNRDPEVTRYLNRPVDAAATRAFYQRVNAHWDRHGYGLWALESREPGLAGRFLGFAGVDHPAFIPELVGATEIGWRLDYGAWGRGLATEAALAARDDAFERLGLDRLISIIHPQNARSQRVAQKLGMSWAQLVHNPVLEMQVEVWRIARPG